MKILSYIDINLSKDVLKKVLSEFFGIDLKERKRIQIRINEAEIRCHPYLYLLRFLLFCEKNLIEPGNIRIMYIDTTYSLNDHLIKLRFPNFASRIYCISAGSGQPFEIPKFPAIPEVFTIFISDSTKNIQFKNQVSDCDLDVGLIIRED